MKTKKRNKAPKVGALPQAAYVNISNCIFHSGDPTVMALAKAAHANANAIKAIAKVLGVSSAPLLNISTAAPKETEGLIYPSTETENA